MSLGKRLWAMYEDQMREIRDRNSRQIKQASSVPVFLCPDLQLDIYLPVIVQFHQHIQNALLLPCTTFPQKRGKSMLGIQKDKFTGRGFSGVVRISSADKGTASPSYFAARMAVVLAAGMAASNTDTPVTSPSTRNRRHPSQTTRGISRRQN